jgi:hypothetical protein
MFNVVPLVYVACILAVLRDFGKTEEVSSGALVVRGVIPAFAAFGFYRLWLGVVEILPDLFLAKDKNAVAKYYPVDDPNPVEPYQGMFLLDRTNGILNIVYALMYIAVAITAPFLCK